MARFVPTQKQKEALNKVLRASGSFVRQESLDGTAELAKAIELPLRQGVQDGNILDDIFEVIPLESNATSEFPLDFLSPGTEKDFVAFTIPNHGYIPQRSIEGDYVMVPTYDIGGAIDWLLKYARDARWDVVGAAMEAFEGQFIKKLNDDGWHTLLSAGADRNIIVLDSDAAAGSFTKRLISLMTTLMRRNGGGNSTSANRGKLTDVYLSPESMADIRNWNVNEVDDMTRREILVSRSDNALSNIFGVNLHDLDELGEGQEYQLFAANELSVTMPGSKVELVVGLDLSRRDSFIMPMREELQVFEDDTLHRQKRAGVYGWMEVGFAALDNRRVVLGAV